MGSQPSTLNSELARLPHRPPFVFVRELLRCDAGRVAECATSFAADNPIFAGHFPGNPIVPGAILLDEIVAAIAAGRSISAVEVPSAKFLDMVRPGERLVIRWNDAGDGEIRFTCFAGSPERRVVAGSLRFSTRR